jgi:UDP-N-acetylmuramoylalanine--D-glutamate ligase
MNIAILGYGIEGESVYNYYRAKFPNAKITAYDNNDQPKNPLPPDVEFVGGVKDFKGITADLAIKTPAIAPWLVDVSGEATTATREFMSQCPAPIIGVTGTKGKGTTSSLIKSILDAAGKKTWLVGNIGVAALDVLDQIGPDDIVVYELSSFQLWDLDVSPNVAVILAIEPEHLDVHKDFDDYLAAKANIRNYQGPASDYCFYHPTNKYAEQIAVHPTFDSEGNWPENWRDVNDWNWNAFRYNALNDRDDSVWVARYQTDGFYVSKGKGNDTKICDLDALQLPGDHNKENAAAAISAAMVFTDDFAAVESGLRAFQGLPYRIQLIRELDGARYYNDSYSAAPAATKVAVKALPSPIVLIAGGYDRGADYTDFSHYLNEQPNIKKILLIGQTKDKIAKDLKEGTYELINTLNDAVQRAHELASNEDVVLFSPGCASFDMFKDFNDRGQKFTEAVEKL